MGSCDATNNLKLWRASYLPSLIFAKKPIEEPIRQAAVINSSHHAEALSNLKTDKLSEIHYYVRVTQPEVT